MTSISSTWLQVGSQEKEIVSSIVGLGAWRLLLQRRRRRRRRFAEKVACVIRPFGPAGLVGVGAVISLWAVVGRCGRCGPPQARCQAQEEDEEAEAKWRRGKKKTTVCLHQPSASDRLRLDSSTVFRARKSEGRVVSSKGDLTDEWHPWLWSTLSCVNWQPTFGLTRNHQTHSDQEAKLCQNCICVLLSIVLYWSFSLFPQL